MSEFWDAVNAQLMELRKARSADDVLRILSRERVPDGHSKLVAGDGFFAGSGGDDTVEDALTDAGWTLVWSEASYYYAMKGPDGSVITYVEGDIYRGDRKAQRTQLPDGRVSEDPDGFDCYSDHAHDIQSKGCCDFCGSTDVEIVGHVLPDAKRFRNVDPVKASAYVLKQGYATFDGVLLDSFSASAVQTVYGALTEENKAKLRDMTLTRAVTVCFRIINKAERTNNG